MIVGKHTIYLAFASFLLGSLFVGVCGASAATEDAIAARDVIDYANEERLMNGLSILTQSDALNQVAQKKLDDMFVRDYFAHTSPDGVTPWTWFDVVGYTYKFAGENLAMDFTSADDQHQAWMNSPTHRENILESRYAEIGVAVGRGIIEGRETIVTVQIFATPKYVTLPVTEIVEESAHAQQSAMSVEAAVLVKGVKDIAMYVEYGAINASTYVYYMRSYVAWTLVAMVTAFSLFFEYVFIARHMLYRREVAVTE